MRKSIVLVLIILGFSSCGINYQYEIEYEITGSATEARVEMGENYNIIGVVDVPWNYKFTEDGYYSNNNEISFKATNISGGPSNMILTIYVDNEIKDTMFVDGDGNSGTVKYIPEIP